MKKCMAGRLPHHWVNVLGVLSLMKTTSWSLLGIRQMRMRNISWRMTSCYYPFWKHSLSAHANYRLLEMPNVYSLWSSRIACRSYQQPSYRPATVSRPRTALDTPLCGDHLVLCGLQLWWRQRWWGYKFLASLSHNDDSVYYSYVTHTTFFAG
jgi:hypothetical protein